jgi:hypothetical protein
MFINDAHIKQINYSSEGIELYFVNWKDEDVKIKFIDVIIFKAVDPIGSEFELTEEAIRNNSPYDNIIKKLEYNTGDYKLFKLISPWGNNDTFIEIIAKEIVE